MGYITVLMTLLIVICLLVLLTGIISWLVSNKEKEKKDALVLINYSIIGLIIGFGTCFYSLS
jgi:uncharacterized membrane protein HdeD (DUF308 family)